ncbi:MAG: SprT family zinc-dependent metalloprotease [Candidatus Gastranaerophilales bacterium]|nr:SprT family zinc-dependent metalloprotease [Candidatus Gastranaerophilales bacterium]
MNKHFIEIDEVGKILLRKSKRAKRINIRIKQNAEIRVTIPFYLSFKNAQSYIIENKEWIIKNTQKLSKLRKEESVFDEKTDFSTKKHKLIIEKTFTKKITSKIKDNKIFIQIPDGFDIKNQYIQNIIKKAILQAKRIEARDYLPNRVEILAKKYGFFYKDLYIKNLKSRWGSCSGMNNINLNLHLMDLPDELIDYVILHELTHTIEKNHGISFWKKLENILPETKELNKNLKKFSIQ